MTSDQQKQWAAHLAPSGVDPATLERLVTVELPDVAISWEYEKAYSIAARQRTGLLPPVITSWEQWRGRERLAHDIIERLMVGLPPDLVFVALAVPKK